MSLITAFKGLSWVAKWGGIVSIPILGPIAGIIGGVIQLIWMTIQAMLKGMAVIVASPLAAFATVLIIISSLIVGVKVGTNWSRHLVEAARADLASTKTRIEGVNSVDKAKAEAAIEAREIAKKLPIFPNTVILSVPQPAAATAVDTPSATPKRLRAPKRAKTNSGGSDDKGVFGF